MPKTLRADADVHSDLCARAELMPSPAEPGPPLSGDHDLFRYDIFRFVALSGPRGYRWVEEYHAAGADRLGEEASRALILLRQGAHDAARERLAAIEEALEGYLRGEVPAVRHVVERWYASVLAYRHYREGDFDSALCALDRAEAAVRAAIELELSLLPFAHHCTDFRFQRARVARNRRRWREMAGHLEVSRDMAAGRAPICVLGDGRAITISALQAFYAALPLAAEDREALAGLLDDEVRIGTVERAIIRFCATIGGVIPYP